MHTIFVTGMERSGTTWIARALAAAARGRYVHEPFNWFIHGGDDRSRYFMKYLPSGHSDPGFSAILQAAVDAERRPRLTRLRNRVVVKDVYSCLAVEVIEEQLDSLTAIVVRHPCATALSWARLEYNLGRNLRMLLGQEALLRDHLGPFASHMRKRENYFFQLGARWGAIYYTLTRLAEDHPDWLWVSHEAVCRDPVAQLESLLRAAGLRMGASGRRFLAAHDQEEQEERPYSLRRVTTTEPDKWRNRLRAEDAALVIEGAAPFGVLERFYPNG